MAGNPKNMPRKAGKRADTVKVCVLFPREIHRKIERLAKRNRRKLSPQVVEITESGLKALEAAIAASG
jgi:UDP-N-acetylmuramyl pentapeptide synthase